MKPYRVPTNYTTYEEEIKKSRFIAHLKRVSNQDEAKEFVKKISEEHSGANHNCWAFLHGAAGDTAKAGMSDDGEPQSTAGKPMLNMLVHSGIGEVAVVVTRYFGGVKLGTGGLVRAYSGMTKSVLEVAETELIEMKTRFSVTVPYNLFEIVKKLIQDSEITIESEDFTDSVTITCNANEEKFAALEKPLTDITASKAKITVIEKAVF